MMGRALLCLYHNLYPCPLDCPAPFHLGCWKFIAGRSLSPCPTPAVSAVMSAVALVKEEALAEEEPLPPWLLDVHSWAFTPSLLPPDP